MQLTPLLCLKDVSKSCKIISNLNHIQDFKITVVSNKLVLSYFYLNIPLLTQRGQIDETQYFGQIRFLVVVGFLSEVEARIYARKHEKPCVRSSKTFLNFTIALC